MNSVPRIAIVGGGPAGLTLARILQNRGVASTVFERDPSPDFRPQGGTLDLHAESGQHALRVAGLEREFLAMARYEDQGTRLYDRSGELLLDDADSTGDRPEVDRTALRQALLDSLAPETVRWGARIDAVEPLPDGRHAIGGEPFDLVVGADGAWSKVRPLVSDATPAYTGVTLYEFGLDDVDRRHPEAARLVGRGKLFAVGEGKAIIAQLNGGGHIRVYAGLPVPEADLGREPDGATLLAHYAGWSDTLLRLLREGTRMRAWPLVALPVGHAWAHRRGVTLIGDAAHVMSPFSGEGVNLAMLDACELALAISERTDLREYEATMQSRAAHEAAGAMQGLVSTFAPDGLENALAWMKGHADVN